MVGDAKGDIFVFAQNQAGPALLGRASDASPVVLPVSSVQEVVDDEQRSLALAVNVL